jgi:hypothetical protein
MSEGKIEARAPALSAGAYQAAAAAFTFSEEHSGTRPSDFPAATPADSNTSKSLRNFSIDTPDIVAIGILILAMAAALVAVIVAFGFVFGKASGQDTVEIIGTCVGGSTISGIVAALVGRKSQSRG